MVTLLNFGSKTFLACLDHRYANLEWTTCSSPFLWGELLLGIEASSEWEDITGAQSRRSVI